jgi:hypothetical protein
MTNATAAGLKFRRYPGQNNNDMGKLLGGQIVREFGTRDSLKNVFNL